MKYRFEILYANQWLQQVAALMNKLDLGPFEIGIQEVMTFTSDKDLNIKKVKSTIKKAYELCECNILDIKGGKVE